MRRVLHIAVREFVATVLTKGFLFGLVVMPVIIVISIIGIRLIMNEKAPAIEGEVAIVDPTGRVAEGVREYLRPEAIAARRDATRAKIEQATPPELRGLAAGEAGNLARESAIEAALGSVPRLDVVVLDRGTEIDAAKKPLLEGDARSGGRLALVVVEGNAIVPDVDDETLGSYDLFVREKLDDRIEDEIQDGLREAIIDARVEEAGLDRERIESLTSVKRRRSVTVTAEGEKKTNVILNALLPAAFMGLLFVAVMTGGQALMTSTVEEKSSRVVEVLLSAVSPMQLMTGKILGQLLVGFVILAIYGGMGILALVSFAMMGFLDLSLLFYLVVFYVIAYFVVGALLASIGAAVNEMREAQNLMGPVMIFLMIPWLLWMPLSRNPDATWAVVMSFIPPINSFVTLVRLASTSPPPAWQVWLSIAIGVASVYGALWFAAKVFRIGILMHGKPPSIKTLIAWARMG